MSISSRTAKHCHSALKTLLDNLSSSQYEEDLDHFTTSLSSTSKRPASSNPHLDQGENENEQLSKRQRLQNTKQDANDSRLHDGTRVGIEDVAGLNNFESNPNFSNYSDSAMQFWDVPYASNFTGNEHPAYTNDMFSQLSFENLLQYDDSFGTGLWNSNQYPEI